MNREERYEVNKEGQLVVGLPTTLKADERKSIIEKIFSQNGWIYELLSEETGSHFRIKLINHNLDKEYTFNLYHANIRKEDPNRSREEKKIQLGKSNDPREHTNDGIILGFYIYNNAKELDDIIIVAWPIEDNKNYPENPSLRVNMKNDILVAKNIGYYEDRITGKNIVVFKAEFIYYYLENYKKIHYSDNNIQEVLNIEDTININFSTGYNSEVEYNRIVFGAPGTGKSYTLKKDCEDLIINNKGTYERVTFHPDYTYSHFVGTYKPVTDNTNSEIKYEFVPGPFMRTYVSALKSGMSDNPKPHLLLIEEINRAKVASVFGDVFQLLDRNKNGVSEYEIHTNEDIKNYLAKEFKCDPQKFDIIKIPDNMFIWATMNSADQGVFPMDTAFKRRWSFEYLGINKNDEKIRGKIVLGENKYALEIEWNRLRKAINEKLAEDYKVNEDKLMGPYFLSEKVIKINNNDIIIDSYKFKESFKNKVIMYLYEDAAKQYRHKLFEGCNSNGYSTAKYSSVCEAFDKIGIDIFGADFKEIYDNQGV